MPVATDVKPFAVRPLAQDEVDRVSPVLGLARLDLGDGFYLVASEQQEPGACSFWS